ncbi:hypothetical protein SNE40_007862 [Patella caerulea]|uniref:Uncharacterized protein n=1 Tax=Patella caerulea TaxID=87958 RepID=A0AAN8PUB3_PATCE
MGCFVFQAYKDQLTYRTCQNIKSSRAAVSVDVVESYFKNLAETLNIPNGEPTVPPSNIFNYDETNLADDPGVKKCLFKRGVKYATMMSPVSIKISLLGWSF